MSLEDLLQEIETLKDEKPQLYDEVMSIVNLLNDPSLTPQQKVALFVLKHQSERA